MDFHFLFEERLLICILYSQLHWFTAFPGTSLLSIGLSNGSVEHIKVFGSASYVHVPKALSSKLDPKSVL